MIKPEPTPTTASSLPARKITRQQLAAHCGLSVRLIDELTSTGVLGHFKIGKSVRYDLAEAESDLRARFHVPARSRAPGREGCPQPSAPKPMSTVAPAPRQDSLPHEVDHGSKEHRETHGGGLRTSLPTTGNATTRPAPGREGCPQPSAPKPMSSEPPAPRQDSLPHEVDHGSKEHRETHGGGLRTSLPTTGNATARPAPGREGCPQPSAPKPMSSDPPAPRQDSLPHEVDHGRKEHRETHGGGLRTSLPTTGNATTTLTPQA
ncbi:flagellar biosynthesis protein FlhF [Prosthecobacter vanneervenii]|uniref:Helix-turn-helix domain-containing protein n=1 Tax=Prosthecobacter vanneervenii TaxID=48466 RepID=A0A7W8DI11_9BACT|nr:hypothetical protein [Prosthecobacter vanneervenii]MBB5030543.1 hypothetical protein [Prosthecobacter vanneervenii]